MTDRTAETHRLFRGSAEVAKFMRVIALGMEFVAAGVSLHAILVPGYEGTMWRPIITFLFVVGATVIRGWSTRYASFSERCRIVSTRAYANGLAVPSAEYWRMEGDAPPFALWFAKRLPASDLASYFEATSGPGNVRLREIYAHSAFYTWKLTKYSGVIYLVCGILVVASALIATYYLAAARVETPTAHISLDAVYSVLLAFLGLRPIAAGLSYLFGSADSRTIADALLSVSTPEGTVELTHDYDRAAAMTPPAPTFVYKLFRDHLQRIWWRRRESLNE